MGSSIKRLFDDELSLSDVLREHKVRVDGEISSLEPSALTGSREQSLIDRLSYKPARLRREGAEVHSEAVGSSVGVTLRIPFDGNPDVFRHRPVNGVPTLEARMHDGSGFYSDDPDEQPCVAFERLFASDVPVEDVREWASGVADQLKEILGESRSLIDAFNAKLVPSISDALARRDAAIRNSASLAGSLGPGV